MTQIPQVLYGYWHQGKNAAPDRVMACWDLWARMNPDWELRILDWDDLKEAFHTMGIAHGSMPYASLSDVARMTMLAREGGVWVDAFTVPLAPLNRWLPDLTPTGFFTYHDPHRKRLAENWFIASCKDHPLTVAWHKTLVRYWSRERRPMRFKRELDPGSKGDLARLAGRVLDAIQGPPSVRARKRVIDPKKPVWAVSPAGGGRYSIYPYHAFAMCFDLMMDEHPELWDEWSRMPKKTSYDCLLLRHWKKSYDRLTPEGLDQICEGKVMQKLALPTPLPQDLWTRLCTLSEAAMPSEPPVS